MKNIFQKRIIIYPAVFLLVIFGFYVFEALAISITSGPLDVNTDATSTDIIWTTNENGDSQVYYTANTTPSWTTHLSGMGNFAWVDIDSVDRNHVWAVGNWSGDGSIQFWDGVSWTQQFWQIDSVFLGVSALDQNHVWVVGSDGLVRFFDGTSWSIQANLVKQLRKVQAISPTEVYAVGRGQTGGGAIYKYDGASWSELATYGDNLLDLWVLDANNIWVAQASSPNILFYDGSSFSIQYNGPFYSYSIDGVDANHIWAGSNGGILFYDGTSWVTQFVDAATDYFNIDALNQNDVWAVGNNAGMSYTDDGQNWIKIAPPKSFTYYAIHQVSGSQVWTGGYDKDFYLYGINFENVYFDATQVMSHTAPLNGLSTDTTYLYYVCSKNAAGAEVCSNDRNFTTLGTCPDGTLDGMCNASDWYCDGTVFSPPGEPNCVQCGFDCSTNPMKHYCNPATEACENKCADGTNPGACNGSNQYCDPANNQISNDCAVNQAQCSFVCPAPTPYCNPVGGVCEAKCSDGTAFGACNGSQQYCDSGTLVPAAGGNCIKCGFICPVGQPFCNPATEACEAKCADGTASGACNGSEQYCDPVNLQLSNDCAVNQAQCGFVCPAPTPYCDPVGGVCEAKCSDGTLPNTCNASKQWCDASLVLHTDCTTNIAQCGFVCPAATPFCDPTGVCIAKCIDGTDAGACNAFQEWCNPAILVLEQNCTKCGYTCPVGTPFCNAVTGVCEGDKCADGTPLDACNAFQEWCNPGSKTLELNCNKCGYTCPAATPYCNLTGVCEAKCPDGTPPGGCSGTQYCDPGSLTLENNCNECGYVCPAGAPFCNVGTGVCEAKCADGTVASGCNGDQYCDPADLLLKNDCRFCGYACVMPLPQCNIGDGTCEADTDPPLIININAVPGVFDVVISFDTTEPASSIVTINTTPTCNGDVTTFLDATFISSHSYFIAGLNSNTTYWFCITAEDQSANTGNTGDPSIYQFTTLSAPDFENPVVSILTPTEGEEISGNYLITLSATDNNKIDFVEVTFDETLIIGILLNPPWEINFNSTLYANGAYTLRARAEDPAGNEGVTPIRNFTIKNDLGPPVISNVKVVVDVDPKTSKHYAIITWDTDEEANSRIDYTIEDAGGSYDPLYGNDINCLDPGHCVQDGAYVFNHTIKLDNLEANRIYHYRITTCDVLDNCSN